MDKKIHRKTISCRRENDSSDILTFESGDLTWKFVLKSYGEELVGVGIVGGKSLAAAEYDNLYIFSSKKSAFLHIISLILFELEFPRKIKL